MSGVERLKKKVWRKVYLVYAGKETNCSHYRLGLNSGMRKLH